MCQQGGDNVSITVISNDEIWFALQLFGKLVSNILGVGFQVWPDLESGDPLANHALLVSEGNTENMAVLCAVNLLQTLPTGGSYCVWEQTCDLNNTQQHQEISTIISFN